MHSNTRIWKTVADKIGKDNRTCIQTHFGSTTREFIYVKQSIYIIYTIDVFLYVYDVYVQMHGRVINLTY